MKYFIILLLISITSLAKEKENFFESYFKNAGEKEAFSDYLLGVVEAYAKQSHVDLKNQVQISVAELDGRSLESPHDSMKYRRASYFIQTSDNQSSFVPILLGYTPKSRQVEALVWNPDKASYEAFVIKDVGPKLKPKIKKSNTLLCESCHQNSLAPIFSKFPWNDTTENAKLSEAFREENSKLIKLNDPLFNFSGTEFFDGNIPRSENYNILKSHSFNTVLAAIDEAVRRANFGTQMGKACLDLCKGNSKCKKLIFSTILFGSNQTIKDNLIQQLKPIWPDHGYAHRSSVIASYNPITDQTEIVMSKRNQSSELEKFSEGLNGDSKVLANITIDLFDGLFANRNLNTSDDNEKVKKNPVHLQFMNQSISGSTETEEDEAIFNFVIGIKNRKLNNSKVFKNPGNPANLRPLIGKMNVEEFVNYLETIGSVYCTNGGINLNGIEANKIFDFIMSDRSDEMFEKLEIHQIAAQLPEYYLNSKPETEGDFCSDCETIDKLSNFEYLASNETYLEEISDKSIMDIKDDEIKSMFASYCGKCHLGQTNTELPLPLNDTKKLSKYKVKSPHFKSSQGSETARRIETQEMPPSSSPESNALSSRDREKMVKYLKKLSQE